MSFIKSDYQAGQLAFTLIIWVSGFQLGAKSSADVDFLHPISSLNLRSLKSLKAKSDLVEVVYEDEFSCTFAKYEKKNMVRGSDLQSFRYSKI